MDGFLWFDGRVVWWDVSPRWLRSRSGTQETRSNIERPELVPSQLWNRFQNRFYHTVRAGYVGLHVLQHRVVLKLFQISRTTVTLRAYKWSQTDPRKGVHLVPFVHPWGGGWRACVGPPLPQSVVVRRHQKRALKSSLQVMKPGLVGEWTMQRTMLLCPRLSRFFLSAERLSQQHSEMVRSSGSST